MCSVLPSSNRTIKYLLDQYQMTAELFSSDSFLHSAHGLGECQVTQQASPDFAMQKSLPSYDDIFVILIRRQLT